MRKLFYAILGMVFINGLIFSESVNEIGGEKWKLATHSIDELESSMMEYFDDGYTPMGFDFYTENAAIVLYLKDMVNDRALMKLEHYGLDEDFETKINRMRQQGWFPVDLGLLDDEVYILIINGFINHAQFDFVSCTASIPAVSKTFWDELDYGRVPMGFSDLDDAVHVITFNNPHEDYNFYIQEFRGDDTFDYIEEQIQEAVDGYWDPMGLMMLNNKLYILYVW